MRPLRVRLGHIARGTMGEDEEWWCLVFDPDTGRLYVEHTWDTVQLFKLQKRNGGSQQIEVKEFLESGPSTPRQELQRLIGELFSRVTDKDLTTRS